MQHKYNVVRNDKTSHKAGMARGGRPPGGHNAGHGSEEQGREAAAGRQAAVRLTVRGRRRARRGVYGCVYGALRLEEGRGVSVHASGRRVGGGRRDGPRKAAGRKDPGRDLFRGSAQGRTGEGLGGLPGAVGSVGVALRNLPGVRRRPVRGIRGKDGFADRNRRMPWISTPTTRSSTCGGWSTRRARKTSSPPRRTTAPPKI